MAQKSKAAARQPSKGKAKVVKPTLAKAKPAVKALKAAPAVPAAVVKAQASVPMKAPPGRMAAGPTVVKTEKTVKSVKPMPPQKPPPAKAPTVPVAPKVTAEPQIVQAKAALKKEKVAAAPKSRSRRISVEIQPNEAASALALKWSNLYKKAEQIEAKPYNMKGVFEEKTAIVHKVLGWGYILANRNDRLEVLFKDGIKYLISNYKP